MAHLPDEWKWMDEIPPSWEPPAELCSPTRFPDLNLAVILLSSEIIGNDIIKLVGEHIAARCALTIWMARHEPQKSFKEAFLLEQMVGKGLESIYRAWLPYSAAFRASGGRVGTYEDERAALVTALQEAIEALRSARDDVS